MTDTPTSAAIFIAGLASSAAQMTDDELLSQINAHDPLDAEFAKRFRALSAERDALDETCITWSEVSQRNYQRAKAAEAERDALKARILEMEADAQAAMAGLEAALARAEAAETAIQAALERLDASLFTNAEHQHAKDILRGALKGEKSD